MSEQRDPLLIDHEADGIQELDNFLPGWWLWLFYITVIFGFIYLGYYHVFGLGRLSGDNYENEMVQAAAMYGITDAANAVISEEPTLDEPTLAKGKTVFMTHCLSCHRADGGGLVGPNFCDDHFIHGPAFADSVRTVNQGVPAKGMISWRPILRPDDIQAVCSYIWTLRGSDPPNPKAPEGEQHAI